MQVNIDLPVTLKTESGIAFGRVVRLEGEERIAIKTDRKLQVGERLTLKMELPGTPVPFTCILKVARTGGIASGQRGYDCAVDDCSEPDRERYQLWLETHAGGGSSTRPDVVVDELQDKFDMRMSSANDVQVAHTLKAIDETLGQQSKSKDPYGFEGAESDSVTDVKEGDRDAVLNALRSSLAARKERDAKRPARPTPSPKAGVAAASAAPAEEDDGSWLDELGGSLDSLDLGVDDASHEDGLLSEDDFDSLIEEGGVLEDIIEDDEDDDSFIEVSTNADAAAEYQELIDDDEFDDDDTGDLRPPPFTDDSDVPQSTAPDEVVQPPPEIDETPTVDLDPEEEDVEDEITAEDLFLPHSPEPEPEAPVAEEPAADDEDVTDMDTPVDEDAFVGETLVPQIPPEDPELPDLDLLLPPDDLVAAPPEPDPEPYEDEPDTDEVPVAEEPVAEEPVAEEPVAEEPEPVAEEPEPVAEEPEAVAEEPAEADEPDDEELAASGPHLREDAGTFVVSWASRDDFADSWESGLKKKKLDIQTSVAPPAEGLRVPVRFELHDGQVLALMAMLDSEQSGGFTLAVEVGFAAKTKLKRAAKR